MTDDAQVISQEVVEDSSPTNRDAFDGLSASISSSAQTQSAVPKDFDSLKSTQVVSDATAFVPAESPVPNTPSSPPAPQTFETPAVLPHITSPGVNSSEPNLIKESEPVVLAPAAPGPVLAPPTQQPPNPPQTIPSPKPTTNKLAIGKLIKIVFASIAAIVVFSSGGYVLAYRFAPSVFYRFTPTSMSSKINALWPLHQDFAQMLPADTEVLITINYGSKSGQSANFNDVIKRIPGLSSSGDEFKSELNRTLQSEYGISLADDIANTFAETAYIAIPNIEGNSSILAAIKVKDVAKGAELLTKIQSSNSGDTLFPTTENYRGINIYGMKSSNVNIPTYKNLLQALNLNNNSKKIALAQSSNCTPPTNACNTSVTTNPETVAPAVTVLDRFVIIGGSVQQIKTYIDQSLQNQKALSSNPSYIRVAQEKPSLANVYVNVESTVAGLRQKYVSSADSLSSYLDALNGYKSWSGQVSAESSGLILRGELYYDSAKTDALTGKVLSDKDSDLIYPKTLPASTGFYGEEGNFGAKVEQLANLKYNETQSFNEIFDQNYGVKLLDIANLFSGKYSFAYLPKSNSGLVLQAEVNDAVALSSSLDSVKTKLETLLNDAGLEMGVNYYMVGETTVTTFSVGNLFGSVYDFNSIFSPSYAIKDNRLILSSNFNGVKDLLNLTGDTLESDKQMKSDIKTVAVPSRLFVYANSNNIYYGVVDSIRALTGNADLTTSDQERVVNALLKVFPSVTIASHSETNHNTGITTVPVVTLSKDEFDEIDKLIKTKSASIFNIDGYLNPLGDVSQTNPTHSEDNDNIRKSDLTHFMASFKAANNGSSGFSKYKTSGDEKLDPNSGIMKQMFDAGELDYVLEDPEWPDYYYTFSNNGTSAKITALLENKPDDAGNCEPTKQIRSRWTWCVKL